MRGAITRDKANPGKVQGGAATLEPLVSIDDVTKLLQCSRRLVDRMRAAGTMPPPDFMAGRLPRWKAATIRAWLDSDGQG